MVLAGKPTKPRVVSIGVAAAIGFDLGTYLPLRITDILAPYYRRSGAKAESPLADS